MVVVQHGGFVLVEVGLLTLEMALGEGEGEQGSEQYQSEDLIWNHTSDI